MPHLHPHGLFIEELAQMILQSLDIVKSCSSHRDAEPYSFHHRFMTVTCFMRLIALMHLDSGDSTLGDFGASLPEGNLPSEPCVDH